MIHGTPQIVRLPTNFYDYLAQLPLPLPALAHTFLHTTLDLVGKAGAEAASPMADGFIANVDPALVQQVFDIAQRQRYSEIYHDRELDDLG